MAFGMNECLRHIFVVFVVLCEGYSQHTIPVNKSRVKLRSHRMCVVRQNLLQSVSKSSVKTESDVSCCLPITPPGFLMVFSSLSLSYFEAFPPQQTQPQARTLITVDKKSTCKISSLTLNDLSFLKQKRRKWTFFMNSSVFSCQASLF